MADHYLADGTKIELGVTRVKDYDCNYGVIEDSIRNREELNHDHKSGRATCNAWFDVLLDKPTRFPSNGDRSFMDCSRMVREGGHSDF